MKVEEYLKLGKYYKNLGYPTDGCSFIGLIISKKYEPACWSHDFGRQKLIDLDDEDQSTNDNMFRNALRHLGMQNWISNIIFWFTRSQGWVRDKTDIDAMFFMVILISAVIISVGIWLNS